MRKVLLLCAIVVSIFTACHKTYIEYPEKSQIIGLASPICLESGITEILLSDYFIDPSLVDSVSGLDSMKVENNVLIIPVDNNELNKIQALKFWIGGSAYSILAFEPRRINTEFIFDPHGKMYKKVQLSANFNNWNPSNTNLTLEEDKWKIILNLLPGTYQYKIVADDKQMIDPDNPDSVDNNIGGFNSLMTVIDGDPQRLPQLLTSRHIAKYIFVETKNEPIEVFALWQNYSVPIKILADGKVRVNIPEGAKKMKRSFIRVWSYNDDGPSNDILIPLEYGNVIENVDLLARDDWQSVIMYFIMVDRFNNGNKENDLAVDDPEIHFRANYQGGDIAGITEKLESGYFEELGFNTIWISPITQNPWEGYIEYPAPHNKYSGYHGYWPITFTTVDKRFGTSEDLQQLVDKLHQKDMNLLLDFVCNHVHEKNPIIQNNPDWATEVDLPDGTKNIRIWDEQRLTTWFDTFLPSLDLENPEVAALLVDSAMFWINEYGIDGFRHDATKHIPESFWRLLTMKVNQDVVIPEDRPVFQIGETFGSRELIGSYVASGKLNAQFDFNLYFDARDVFSNDQTSFRRLNNSILETFDYYGCHHMMGNITGNHDLARFISYASDALAFGEDDKAAGWSREIKVENKIGYKKLSMLTAFIMTIPGVPVVYYGDDIGMPGAGDPDNRRMMRFDKLTDYELEVKENLKKLAHLRNKNMALLYGDFETIHVDDNVYIYTRKYFDEYVVIAFNKSDQNKAVDFELPEYLQSDNIKNNFSGSFVQDGNKLNLVIPAYDFEILLNE